MNGLMHALAPVGLIIAILLIFLAFGVRAAAGESDSGRGTRRVADTMVGIAALLMIAVGIYCVGGGQ